MSKAPDWICWRPREWHALARSPEDPKAPGAKWVTWCNESTMLVRVQHRILSPGEARRIDPDWLCTRCLDAMAGAAISEEERHL